MLKYIIRKVNIIKVGKSMNKIFKNVKNNSIFKKVKFQKIKNVIKNLNYKYKITQNRNIFHYNNRYTKYISFFLKIFISYKNGYLYILKTRSLSQKI